MQVPFRFPADRANEAVAPDMSSHATIAYDQLTPNEQRQIRDALESLTSTGLLKAAASLEVTPLRGPEPLYAIRPAPTLLVVVRATPGTPLEVVDILRPAMFDNLVPRG
jgi:hypothetical protein